MALFSCVFRFISKYLSMDMKANAQSHVRPVVFLGEVLISFTGMNDIKYMYRFCIDFISEVKDCKYTQNRKLIINCC